MNPNPGTLTPAKLAAIEKRLSKSWIPKLKAFRIHILETLEGDKLVTPATYYLSEDTVTSVTVGMRSAKTLGRLNSQGIVMLLIDRVAANHLNRQPRPWKISRLERTLLPGTQALRKTVASGLLEGRIFEPYAELRRNELGAFVAEWRRRHGTAAAISLPMQRAVKMATRRHLSEHLPRPGPKG